MDYIPFNYIINTNEKEVFLKTSFTITKSTFSILPNLLTYDSKIQWYNHVKKLDEGENNSMKTFDNDYVLLDDMYQDTYFPNDLVDLVKQQIMKVICLLETGETNTEIVQTALDEMTIAINDLQEAFDEQDSEIETVARDSIAVTVAYILQWFAIPIDIETAIQERDW